MVRMTNWSDEAPNVRVYTAKISNRYLVNICLRKLTKSKIDRYEIRPFNYGNERLTGSKDAT